MNRVKKLLLLGLGIAIVWSQFSPVIVLGATNNNGNNPTLPGQALEIDPPLIELSGNRGQTLKTQIQIRNISSGPVVVTNQINDFTAKGETGVPDIILHASPNNPYSLLGYISPLPDFTLKSQQLKKLNVNINIPSDASPGGHYGVIRFTGTPASLNGKSGVSLSASLGALILLTVNGHIVENLKTYSFSVGSTAKSSSGFFQSDPFVFSEVLQNTGNVHVAPTGTITMKDFFGHTVLKMNVNQGLGNVLPGTKRQFTEEVSNVAFGGKRFFGRYTATFNVTYGSSKKTLSGSLSFWVIPIDLILIWIAVLIGGFFLIRHLIRRYNQHIVDRAQKSSRKKK